MGEILNLDKLKAESRKVIFLSKEYELGYIPSGAAIPLIESYNDLLSKQAKAAGGMDIETSLRYAKEHAEDVVKDSIDFITKFCSFFYPEVTKEEIAKDASKEMVDAFFTEIITAIVRNSRSEGSPEESDNESKKNRTLEKQ